MDDKLISTTLGELPLSQLVVEVIHFEDDNEKSEYTEYRYKGELVKRAVHVHLKHGTVAGIEVGE